MKTRRIVSKLALGLTASATLMFSSQLPAQADGPRDTSSEVTTSISARAVPLRTGSILKSVSDYDLLMLLFAGVGPVADAHPEIVKAFGFATGRQQPDLVALNKVIRRYQKVAPEFKDSISVLVRSGDPLKVRAGLEEFKDSFLTFFKEDAIFAQVRSYLDKKLRQGYVDVTGRGRVNTVQGVNVAYGVNVVAAAAVVVGTVAGVVTLVVLVGAVLVVYLGDPESDNTSMDMRLQMAAVVDSLSQ